MNSFQPNRLLKLVNQINTQVPTFLRSTVLSLAFNSQIKYAGTTGIAIRSWTAQKAVVSLPNRFRVRNHLGGVHATAMATLAESATGMVFGIHVPDTHIPLLKRMTVRYHKVARGDLTAVATISEEQIKQIQSQERGSVIVPVRVTDQDDTEPIAVDMEWAWTIKKHKNNK